MAEIGNALAELSNALAGAWQRTGLTGQCTGWYSETHRQNSKKDRLLLGNAPEIFNLQRTSNALAELGNALAEFSHALAEFGNVMAGTLQRTG
jgi:hypothetical protein